MSNKQGDPKQVTLDHVRRRADGGGGNIENLVAACRECNEARGQRDQQSAVLTPPILDSDR